MLTPKDVALDWARQGKPVFPCDPRSKRPLTPNGYKNATTDEDQIDFWWEEHPDAMVGLPTGTASGLLVLDFDVDEAKGIDARPAIEAMVASGEIPSDAYRVRTPRGGWHVYLAMPEADIRIGTAVGGVQGFDVRGNGGYVIAPGSTRAGGGRYEAVESSAPFLAAPAALVKRLRKPQAKQASAPLEAGEPDEAIPEGQRNDRLFREAAKLGRAGLRGGMLLAALRGINTHRCQPPLPDGEVVAMADRVNEQATSGDVQPRLEPVLIGELDPGDTGEPIWEGLLAKGTTTLLSAREKSGKTTLLGMLLRETAKPGGGQLLGLTVHPVRALVISEESAGQWCARRDDDGLPEDLLIVTRTYPPPSDLGGWDQMCDSIIDYATDQGVGLVVIDTWAHWNPTESENDNAQVARAARALGRIAEAAGVSVLLIHHMSKAGGSRGGTALPASVDTIVEMRRSGSRTHDADLEEEGDDGSRIFDISGRLDPPPRIIATWNGSTYVVESAKTMKHLKVDRLQGLILGTLRRIGEGQCADIEANWPDGDMSKPSGRTLMRDLKKMIAANSIEVVRGSGGANDPRVYRPRQRQDVIPA